MECKLDLLNIIIRIDTKLIRVSLYNITVFYICTYTNYHDK
jgi:hypothetical protein